MGLVGHWPALSWLARLVCMQAAWKKQHMVPSLQKKSAPLFAHMHRQMWLSEMSLATMELTKKKQSMSQRGKKIPLEQFGQQKQQPNFS